MNVLSEENEELDEELEIAIEENDSTTWFILFLITLIILIVLVIFIIVYFVCKKDKKTG